MKVWTSIILNPYIAMRRSISQNNFPMFGLLHGSTGEIHGVVDEVEESVQYYHREKSESVTTRAREGRPV